MQAQGLVSPGIPTCGSFPGTELVLSKHCGMVGCSASGVRETSSAVRVRHAVDEERTRDGFVGICV